MVHSEIFQISFKNFITEINLQLIYFCKGFKFKKNIKMKNIYIRKHFFVEKKFCLLLKKEKLKQKRKCY